MGPPTAAHFAASKAHAKNKEERGGKRFGADAVVAGRREAFPVGQGSFS